MPDGNSIADHEAEASVKNRWDASWSSDPMTRGPTCGGDTTISFDRPGSSVCSVRPAGPLVGS